MSFKCLGIRIIIDYYFVLILCFGLLFNAGDVLNLLLFSFLHELGHLVLLLCFKTKPSVLKLSFYGAAIRYDSQLSKDRESLVILAGPLVNLVLYLVFRNEINLLLFVLNMLPIYPIDFGRIIALYSYRLARIISYVFLVALFGFALSLLILYHSFSLLFIACYLLFYSINY